MELSPRFWRSFINGYDDRFQPKEGSGVVVSELYARAYDEVVRRAGLVEPPAASVILQAVVEFGERTREGDIIIAVFPAWEEIIRQILMDPKFMYQVDPRKWEEIIAANYERSGLFDEVTLTPRSGDFGRDIIATKRGYWSVRIIESVKHYKPDHLVRADEVRALSGVLHGDQKATKGIVSTTSDFAPRIEQDPYIAPLVPTRLELINGEQLLARLAAAMKQR